MTEPQLEFSSTKSKLTLSFAPPHSFSSVLSCPWKTPGLHEQTQSQAGVSTFGFQVQVAAYRRMVLEANLSPSRQYYTVSGILACLCLMERDGTPSSMEHRQEDI